MSSYLVIPSLQLLWILASEQPSLVVQITNFDNVLIIVVPFNVYTMLWKRDRQFWPRVTVLAKKIKLSIGKYSVPFLSSPRGYQGRVENSTQNFLDDTTFRVNVANGMNFIAYFPKSTLWKEVLGFAWERSKLLISWFHVHRAQISFAAKWLAI